ncbi:MAG: methyltransferase domain-containing protein [Chitinophagaceae bacterium]|nr:MAG: methyltransferase domain-containing protein [Chitinophagaceae bacterium]
MPNNYFQFKQFRIEQEHCAMKVCTDACLFGAWFANRISGKSSILDIGSGTGLLLMMLAQKASSDSVLHGIEIEDGCFEQLKSNVNSSPWADRIQLFHGDVRGYTLPLQYDFIISNPPFYENDLSSDHRGKQLAMHTSALRFDDLAEVIQKNLSRSGTAAILLPFHRAEGFVKVMEKQGFFLTEELRVKQSPKHTWFRSVMHFGFEKKVLSTEEMIINDDAFKTLMADYYLR